MYIHYLLPFYIFRFDMDKGKNVLIHNDTGNSKVVFKTGELIRHCDPTLTGVASFQERVEYAKDVSEHEIV